MVYSFQERRMTFALRPSDFRDLQLISWSLPPPGLLLALLDAIKIVREFQGAPETGRSFPEAKLDCLFDCVVIGSLSLPPTPIQRWG